MKQRKVAQDERKTSRLRRTLIRIAILLVVLLVLMMMPAIFPLFLGNSGGSRVRPAKDFARLPGNPPFVYRDYDQDGQVDCLLKVPSIPFFRRAYAASSPHPRCSGRGVEPMPDSMQEALSELLRLRYELRELGELIDLDSDGRVDCIAYNGTVLRAEDRNCPDPVEDVRLMDEPSRVRASRALALEKSVRAMIGG